VLTVGVYGAVLALFLGWRLVGGDLALYHFTYWGLLLSFGLSVTWVGVCVVDTAAGRSGASNSWEAAVLALVGPFVFGVLFLVAVLITAVPIMDPGIVEAQGGDTQLGLVNFYNLMMHYLPLFVFGLTLVTRWPVARRYLAAMGLGGPPGGSGAQAPAQGLVAEALVAVLALLLPFTVATMYTSLFDFNDAYGVDIVHSWAYAVGYVTAVCYYGTMRGFMLSALCDQPTKALET
jgi:hypothetical protein